MESLVQDAEELADAAETFQQWNEFRNHSVASPLHVGLDTGLSRGFKFLSFPISR